MTSSYRPCSRQLLASLEVALPVVLIRELLSEQSEVSLPLNPSSTQSNNCSVCLDKLRPARHRAGKCSPHIVRQTQCFSEPQLHSRTRGVWKVQQFPSGRRQVMVDSAVDGDDDTVPLSPLVHSRQRVEYLLGAS